EGLRGSRNPRRGRAEPGPGGEWEPEELRQHGEELAVVRDRPPGHLGAVVEEELSPAEDTALPGGDELRRQGADEGRVRVGRGVPARELVVDRLLRLPGEDVEVRPIRVAAGLADPEARLPRLGDDAVGPGPLAGLLPAPGDGQERPLGAEADVR